MAHPWPALDLHFPTPCPPDLPDLAQAVLVDVPPVAVEEFPPPPVPTLSWDDDARAAADVPPERWRIVFEDRDERDRARAALATALAGTGVRVDALDVPDDDWAARSQADLKAITVGRITVAPPWDLPDPSTGHHRPSTAVTIVIEPSMGFGTGHHPTTRLCLEALQSLDVARRRVLDVGTGSGVLALAAARLGAADVLGLDYDRDALANARQNATLNGLDVVRFERADLREADPPTATADIVLANLTGALLASQAAALLRAVRPGGHLVISGFLEHEAPAVFGAFVPPLHIFRAFEDAGWMAAILDKTTID